MKSMIPTLGVKDIATSMRFYQDVLGYTPGMSLPGDDGKLIHGSVQRGDGNLMFGQLREGDAHDQGKLGQGVVLYCHCWRRRRRRRPFRPRQERRRPRRARAGQPVLGSPRLGRRDPDGYLIYVSKETRRSPSRICARRRWPALPATSDPWVIGCWGVGE